MQSSRPQMDGRKETLSSRPQMDGRKETLSSRPQMDGRKETLSSRPHMNGRNVKLKAPIMDGRKLRKMQTPNRGGTWPNESLVSNHTLPISIQPIVEGEVLVDDYTCLFIVCLLEYLQLRGSVRFTIPSILPPYSRSFYRRPAIVSLRSYLPIL